MISYLKKIIESKNFGEIEDYPLIINLLNNMYTSRLLRNFYYYFEIEIPETFLKSITENNKLNKELCEIPELPDKDYFRESILNINIDDLYDEYHYLNETNTSKLLYHINIINYSTFCVKHKSIIKQYNQKDLIHINELLLNILNLIINSLDTYNYYVILLLYKSYLSLPNMIYDRINFTNPLHGGTKTIPIINKSYLYDDITKFINTKNVFFYLSFNTININQFSLFEFTNIILTPIDEMKKIHGVRSGMINNFLHDVVSHNRINRASNIGNLQSYRLYKLLKFIYDNNYNDLKIFPWLLLNETSYDKPFSLYTLHSLIYRSKDIFENLFIDDYDNDEYISIINNLLLLLEKIKIIKINNKILISNDISKDIGEDESKLKLFEIIDELWKFRSMNVLSYNYLELSIIPLDPDYIIENINKDSSINKMLDCEKNDALKRAFAKLSKSSLHKYLKYKIKYLKLKIFNK